MKKGRFSTIILILIFMAGLSLLLYPSIANYWNSVYSTHAISVYSEKTKALTEKEYTEIWEAAQNYNRDTVGSSDSTILSSDDRLTYENLLNLDGNGVMGYIEIPNIKVSLPVFHGTSEEVLQNGVGHLEWTSLPVGGESTHSVLSGHRGLPSAKLFTNLDKLVEGDVFMLRVLNEVLTYEIDQILIVEPQDVTALTIEEGKDYCTLVTCTPYGINTHRMLVRGHRIENAEQAVTVHITAEAIQIEETIVAPIIAAPTLLLLLIMLLLQPNNSGRTRGKRRTDK